MALKCLVKISSVNNLSDARYTAGMGVELMGFDLNPDSEHFVSPEQFNAITSWVSGVKFVGEFDHYNAAYIDEVVSQYPLDYIQVTHLVEQSNLFNCPRPVIIKIDHVDKMSIKEVFEKFYPHPQWFLMEPQQEMSNDLLKWCIQMATQYPIILGSNLTADNIDHLVDAGFSGFALRGGNEIRPGFKNFDELADILEALEIND
jgi:phosphoribosylanthranilate isomerase